MSEPMTNHEIEDVLSSIRRLVSEDLRPAPGRSVAKPVDSKLILTPALRVVSENLPDDVPANQPDDLPPVRAEHPPAEVSTLASFQDSFDIVTAAPVISDNALRLVGAGLDETSGGDPAPAVAEWDDGVWDAAPATDEEMSDDGLADVDLDPADEAPMWTDTASGDVPAWDDTPAEAWVTEDPIPFLAHPRKAAVTPNPLAQAWADRAEADVRAELQSVVEEKLAANSTPAAEPDPVVSSVFSDDAAPFDEEALRDIVRDIIREELAGSLGERITRNVRKLVRVEINRALSAREFE